MKLICWNVNSVRARLAHVIELLDAQTPDVLLMQETKCINEQFPSEIFEERGYSLARVGEKSYNGVAIAVRGGVEDVCTALPGDEADLQARYIEAVVNVKSGVWRVASIYVPNGQSLESEKFPYKLRFLERVNAHAKSLLALEEKTVLAGDFNVAPFAIDVHDPIGLEGSICFHPLERERLRSLLNQGWLDAYRALHPAHQAFTWWDYRAGAYSKNLGLRIDHALLSPQAADALKYVQILTHYRELPQASDHAPLEVMLGE